MRIPLAAHVIRSGKGESWSDVEILTKAIGTHLRLQLSPEENILYLARFQPQGVRIRLPE